MLPMAIFRVSNLLYSPAVASWSVLDGSFGSYVGPHTHVLEEFDAPYEEFFCDFREGDFSISMMLWCEVTPLFPHHPTRREVSARAKLHRRYMRRGKPRVRLLRVPRTPPPGLLLPRPWDYSHFAVGCGVELSDASCVRACVVGLAAQCSGGGCHARFRCCSMPSFQGRYAEMGRPLHCFFAGYIGELKQEHSGWGVPVVCPGA